MSIPTTSVVYPASKRITVPRSRLMSETAITDIIRRLTVDDGTFIVSCDTSKDVELFIKGYYFKFPYSSIGNNQYAYITLDELDSPYTKMYELVGVDSDGSYSGLVFTDTEPTTADGYIKIKNVESGVYSINEDELYDNKRIKPFVRCPSTGAGTYPTTDVPEQKVLSSQIWIDSSHSDILRIFDKTNNQWLPLGAVYK